MNLFMFWKNEQGEDELITAPLDGVSGVSLRLVYLSFSRSSQPPVFFFCKGTILAGVTRKSILDLAREVWATQGGGVNNSHSPTNTFLF